MQDFIFTNKCWQSGSKLIELMCNKLLLASAQAEIKWGYSRKWLDGQLKSKISKLDTLDGYGQLMFEIFGL